MQPIADFPAAAARNLLGVCFDIDDTVTTHGTLDVASYAALSALRAAGLKLLAVTGRPLGFAEFVARTWLVDGAVGENGAGFTARAGKQLRLGYWDDAHTRARQELKLQEIRARVSREMPAIQVSDDHWARRCDLAFDIGERCSVPPAEIDQLVSIIESEGARSTVSSVHAHAQLGDHDKALGVARAARELWNLDGETVRQRFLFVGDSGNDAAAFAWFEWTAGVANVQRALDRLPRAPRFVASTEYGAGFAEIAEAVLRARGAL